MWTWFTAYMFKYLHGMVGGEGGAGPSARGL